MLTFPLDASGRALYLFSQDAIARKPLCTLPVIAGSRLEIFRSTILSVFKNLPAAPVAAKKPLSDTRHGITRTDDYAWFRDENWQAMFKDRSARRRRCRCRPPASLCSPARAGSSCSGVG